MFFPSFVPIIPVSFSYRVILQVYIIDSITVLLLGIITIMLSLRNQG